MPRAAVVEDYHDDSDTDESILSYAEEEDYFQSVDRSSNQAADWYYLTRSERGGEAYGNLPKRKLPPGKFQVVKNYADSMLLADMKKEVPSTLSKIRIKLYGSDQGQEIGPAEAIIAEIPCRAIEDFHEYLKSGALWSFQDIIAFLTGEIHMRQYTCSSSELCEFGFSQDKYTRYLRAVRL